MNTHANGNDGYADLLNRLAEACHDAEAEFLRAADLAADADQAARLIGYSHQYASFKREMAQEICRLGFDPGQFTTVSASIHRGWVTVRSMVKGGTIDAVLHECDSFEDRVIQAYAAALKRTLPCEIDAMLWRQYAGILQMSGDLHGLQASRSAFAFADQTQT